MTAGITSYGVHNIGALALEEAPNMGALEDIGVFAARVSALFVNSSLGGALIVTTPLSGALTITPAFIAELGVINVSS